MTDKKHDIYEELRSLAPKLSQLKKADNQYVPKAYFDLVETQIISQLHLVVIENNAAIELPENYFENFEKGMLKEIKEEFSKPKLRSISNVSKSVFYKIAASLIFVLASILLFNTYNSKEKLETASVSQEEYIQYISDHIEEFDINLLIEQELLNDQVLNNISYLEIEKELDESFIDDNEIILK
jgi:hypothetical protein